jgi:hypothetical protein
MRARHLLPILICLTAPSCVTADDTTDATAFTQTIVHVGADGTPSIEQRTITLDEERALNAAHLSAADGAPRPLAVTEDPACTSKDFLLYDRTDWTGNLLCLRAGPEQPRGALLGSFTRFLCDRGTCFSLTWELTRGSFIAGEDDDGDLATYYPGTHPHKYSKVHARFTAGQAGVLDNLRGSDGVQLVLADIAFWTHRS